MKTRTSFVSNSSSCSFIVACNEAGLQQTLKAIAKKCEDKKSEWHSKDCATDNLRALDFCIHAYELLFLGELCVKTEKEIYNLEYFEKIGADGHQSHRNRTVAAQEFDEYKRMFGKTHSKKSNHSNVYASWATLGYEDDEKIDDDTYVHCFHEFESSIALSSVKKSYMFGNSKPKNFIEMANHVDKIIDIANFVHESHANARGHESLVGNPAIYKITHSTIANTKALMSAGCKMIVDVAKMHKIEKMLDNGYVVFKMRVSHDGDGFDIYSVYCENDAFDVSSIPGITVIESESE